jgi:aminopeptidase N
MYCFENMKQEKIFLIIKLLQYTLRFDSQTFLVSIFLFFQVCHELAHMWFGNYVTMAWWTQLWLNEGCVCMFSSCLSLYFQI